MDIDNEMIDHLAGLAKLNFNEEEKINIKNDLIRILNYVEKLNEVDTENVEPLIFMNADVNVLREDEPKHTLNKKDALLNAPSKDSDYFRVPKFIEK